MRLTSAGAHSRWRLLRNVSIKALYRDNRTDLKIRRLNRLDTKKLEQPG
jgi:hypothetical protein